MEMPFALENNGSQVYIPLSSIKIGSEKKSVFVLESNNQVRELYIETGEIVGDCIEIIFGLDTGQKLIIDGHRNLKSGQYAVENNE